MRSLTAELADLTGMMEIGSADDDGDAAELAAMAEAEAEELRERRQALGEGLVKTLMKRHEKDEDGGSSSTAAASGGGGGKGGGGKSGRGGEKSIVGAIVEVRPPLLLYPNRPQTVKFYLNPDPTLAQLFLASFRCVPVRAATRRRCSQARSSKCTRSTARCGLSGISDHSRKLRDNSLSPRWP